MNAPKHHAIMPLVEALFDGSIDDQGFARLQSALREDAEARALYRSYANLHATLPSILSQSPRLSLHIEVTEDDRDDALFDPDILPQDQLISLMAQVEAKGEDLDPMVLAAERFPAPPDDSPTKQDWAQAGRYLLRRAGAYRQQGIMAAAAAVMLLASILFLVWGDPDQDLDTLASVPAIDQLDPDQITVLPAPVATLTATLDAQWQDISGAKLPATGDVLRANQRLKLVSGFAQITTNRGATALLEAPCTVQMTEHENELWLHEGKLVGEVESESAQGFVVYTPELKVTDLGTRFGVSAGDALSHVRVFEGEVAALPKAQGALQSHVTAGQSVISAAGASEVILVEDVQERFVTSLHAVARVPVIFGEAVYEPSMPKDLRIGVYERPYLCLFHERSHVVLKEGGLVNVSGPGLYENDALQSPVAIEPVVVDSYLLHLDAPDDLGSSLTLSAKIRFDRPIIGLITNTALLDQTHATLGLPDVRYGSMSNSPNASYSGLDKSTQASPESVVISEDRRTLTIQLSSGIGIDQARVLVQSDATD